MHGVHQRKSRGDPERGGRLIGNDLAAARPGYRVITAPGVNPQVRSESNFRIPDLGVTCAPPSSGQFVIDPVLLVEILSPSNEAETRANVWAYATIPSVIGILLLSALEMKGGAADPVVRSSWPADPILLGADDDLDLASVGLRAPLRLLYRTTSLFRE